MPLSYSSEAVDRFYEFGISNSQQALCLCFDLLFTVSFYFFIPFSLFLSLRPVSRVCPCWLLFASLAAAARPCPHFPSAVARTLASARHLTVVFINQPLSSLPRAPAAQQ